MLQHPFPFPGTCCLGDLSLAVKDDANFADEVKEKPLGHPLYLSPEVLESWASREQLPCDMWRKADVYALGLVMWEIARRCLIQGRGVGWGGGWGGMEREREGERMGVGGREGMGGGGGREWGWEGEGDGDGMERGWGEGRWDVEGVGMGCGGGGDGRRRRGEECGVG